MIEIKFRGLTDSEAPVWVYGCLVNNLWKYSEHSKYTTGTPVCQIITGEYEGDCWEDVASQEDDKAIVTVIPETVGQYTGLKDKNDKEIYESDVVQVVAQDGTRLSKHKIIWSNSRCRFMKHREDGNFFDLETSQTLLEIIGNIYQNPELV
jgi:hypothetical protein